MRGRDREDNLYTLEDRESFTEQSQKKDKIIRKSKIWPQQHGQTESKKTLSSWEEWIQRGTICYTMVFLKTEVFGVDEGDAT